MEHVEIHDNIITNNELMTRGSVINVANSHNGAKVSIHNNFFDSNRGYGIISTQKVYSKKIRLS
jgi:hypothetical protein